MNGKNEVYPVLHHSSASWILLSFYSCEFSLLLPILCFIPSAFSM